MKRTWLITAILLCNFSVGEALALSVDEAVALALNNNTALKVTQKGEDTAKFALKRAKGNKGLSATLSDNIQTYKTNGSKRADGNNLSVSGSLPIYSGGKNSANVDSAKLGVDIASLKTERERENLRYNVIKAYFDILEAKKTVAVNQESVDNYAAHYENVSAQFNAGAKAKIDVLRSSVELSNARQTLIKSQSAFDTNVAVLQNLLNVPGNEPLQLTDDFSFAEFTPLMDECIAYALNNRKDLTVDEFTVRQRDLAVKAAKADWLPGVNLSMGLSESDDIHPQSNNSRSASAGVGVSWNIFDSGLTRATVDSAKTDYDIALLTLKNDKETIELNVRTAYLNMREAEKRFTSTADAVAEAEEDFFIAREKYRAGEGIMLDIIDAQLALSTAKLNYIGAQYDYARYKAELENAMGIPVATSKEE